MSEPDLTRRDAALSAAMQCQETAGDLEEAIRRLGARSIARQFHTVFGPEPTEGKIMRQYHGNPRTLAVEVFDVETKTYSQLVPWLFVVNHSPTGFAWGYNGSGPAQLAFALIADALLAQAKGPWNPLPDEVEDLRKAWKDRDQFIDAGADAEMKLRRSRNEKFVAPLQRASDPRLYEAFKEQVVSRWEGSRDFRITDYEVLQHVSAIESTMLPATPPAFAEKVKGGAGEVYDATMFGGGEPKDAGK